MTRNTLPRGIVSVVQAPFDQSGELDLASVGRLVDDAVTAGVDGFLVPAVASEVEFLSPDERRVFVQQVVRSCAGRVPVILGASDTTAAACLERMSAVASLPLAAQLIAVPKHLYGHEEGVLRFFLELESSLMRPLVIQDFQFNGPGLSIECYKKLHRHLPSLAGVKIETVPAGPKYTLVRHEFGDSFWISGGWAVPQLIEALDRGVDAVIPESSMIRVYRTILDTYASGDRAQAIALFRSLLPVLAFTNQELSTSVAFFKRLLRRKKIFASERQRLPLAGWDAHSERTASELIDYYLDLEH